MVQTGNVCRTCNTKRALIAILAIAVVVLILLNLPKKQQEEAYPVDYFYLIDAAGEGETNAYEVCAIPVLVQVQIIHDRGLVDMMVNGQQHTLQVGETVPEMGGLFLQILKIIPGQGQQPDLVMYGFNTMLLSTQC